MTFTPWHIWVAFLLDLVFGDPKWVPRPETVVLRSVHFLEHPFIEKGVLKIGQKWAGVILAIAVILLTMGVSAGLIFLSGHLHTKMLLAVLLYLAYTTLTMRSFGDRVYGVFQWLQKKKLSSARSELCHLIGYNTMHLTESGVIQATVLAVAGNIVNGVVAPLLYLSLGGVPLAMAYKAINTLHFALGQKDSLYRGWGWGAATIYEWANCIPARITGALMVIGATFLFGTGSKAFMILLRNGWKKGSPNVEIQGSVAAGAIGMTLRDPSADVEVLPLFPLREDEIDEAESHHIVDAIKLMGAVACVMLILCLMM